jgi:hypothetical protein
VGEKLEEEPPALRHGGHGAGQLVLGQRLDLLLLPTRDRRGQQVSEAVCRVAADQPVLGCGREQRLHRRKVQPHRVRGYAAAGDLERVPRQVARLDLGETHPSEERDRAANRTGRDTTDFGRRCLTGQAVRDNERRLLAEYREPTEWPRLVSEEPREGQEELRAFPRLEQSVRQGGKRSTTRPSG